MSGSPDADVSYKCKFIAFREFRAPYTVAPYLLRKFCLVYIHKVHLSENIWMIRQDKDPSNPESFCLADTPSDQLSADSLSLVFGRDCERADFCKILPENMKSTDTEYFSIILTDQEISYILIYFSEGARDHLFLPRKIIYQFVNLFKIRNSCLSNLQYTLSPLKKHLN